MIHENGNESGIAHGNPDRWAICIEYGRCVWTGPDAMPEVDISYADLLCSYETEARAREELNALLLKLHVKATWADVRPIEECGSCGKDFDTAQSHPTIALSAEIGPDDCPVVLDVEYPCRICPECATSFDVAVKKIERC